MTEPWPLTSLPPLMARLAVYWRLVQHGFGCGGAVCAAAALTTSKTRNPNIVIWRRVKRPEQGRTVVCRDGRWTRVLRSLALVSFYSGGISRTADSWCWTKRTLTTSRSSNKVADHTPLSVCLCGYVCAYLPVCICVFLYLSVSI